MSPSSKSGLDRRGLLRGLVAVLGGTGLAPTAGAEPAAPSGQIVRLSRASFPAQKFDEVERRLAESQHTLIPALRGLAGCLHYHAAIDRESSTMINVSVWRSRSQSRSRRSASASSARSSTTGCSGSSSASCDRPARAPASPPRRASPPTCRRRSSPRGSGARAARRARPRRAPRGRRSRAPRARSPDIPRCG